MPDLAPLTRHAIHAHHLLVPGQTVVVAVSGGADSVALLDVLARLAPDLGVGLHVGHLDHGLRPTSADDAAFVADLARQMGLTVTVGAVDVRRLVREERLAQEEAARQARYAFLGALAQAVGAAAVATAHHADDQAETVLLNLLRGAGLAGLRGMQPRAPLPVPSHQNISLIRPFLALPRAEIRAYVAARGLAYREDTTNQDTGFTRNRVRHELLPLLQTYNPAIVATLSRTARSLAEDYEMVQTLVDAAWPQVVRAADGGVTLDLAALAAQPVAVRRHLVRRAIVHAVGLRDVTAEQVEAVVALAAAEATREQVDLPRLTVTRCAGSLFIGGAPSASDWPLLPPDTAALPVAAPGETRLPGDKWKLVIETCPAADVAPAGSRETPRWTEVIDAAAAEGGLWLRPRQPGDRFQPLGFDGHSRSLHDFMTDAHVPRALRDRLPLLVNADAIVWVSGFRLDHRARVTPATQTALALAFQPLEDA